MISTLLTIAAKINAFFKLSLHPTPSPPQPDAARPVVTPTGKVSVNCTLI